MSEISDITVEEIYHNKDKYVLVDVREPHELIGPEGKIEGSFLAPLGPALVHFLKSVDPSQNYVFICRSGVRSAKACEFASAFGLTKVYNMKGGMLTWNDRKETNFLHCKYYK